MSGRDTNYIFSNVTCKVSITNVSGSDTPYSMTVRQGDTTLPYSAVKKSGYMRHIKHALSESHDGLSQKQERGTMEKLNVIRKETKAVKRKRKTSYVKEKMKSSDLFGTMEAIMRHNTRYYQSDFEIDKEILKEAAGSTVKADRTLLWLSRTHGTHCLRERDVFLKNSRAYHTWLYYAGQAHEHVLAYVVEITGKSDGKLTGSLYSLNYGMHCRHVEEAALPVDHIKVIYEHGERIVPAGQCIPIWEDTHLGKTVHFEEQPKDPDILERLLLEERIKRHLSEPVRGQKI